MRQKIESDGTTVCVRARRWTREQAAAEIAAWQRSGKSLEAYAAERGFSWQRLVYWRARMVGDVPLRRQADASILVPVRAVRSSPCAAKTPGDEALESGAVPKGRDRDGSWVQPSRGHGGEVIVQVGESVRIHIRKGSRETAAWVGSWIEQLLETVP